MPQHPKYSISPEKNLEDLNNLLWKLETFGYIHEELDQPIVQLMNHLYPQIRDIYTLSRNDLSIDSKIEDYDLDDIDPYLANISELWDLTKMDQREQFIQDYRNVIGFCVFSENPHMNSDNPEVIKSLVKMRDLGYYRMHLLSDSDEEANHLYKWFDRTVWFPEDVIPIRTGIYEISSLGYKDPKLDGYAYWDGSKWHQKCSLLKACIKQKRSKKTIQTSLFSWRGFLEPISQIEVSDNLRTYQNQYQLRLNALKGVNSYELAEPVKI